MRIKTTPQQRRGMVARMNSGENVAFPFRIPRQFEVLHVFKLQRSEQGPQQNACGDEQGASKEPFEIDARQERKDAVRGDPLAYPIDDGREQCADQNCRGEVNQ